MRVLVVGGGGREHALVWALRRSPSVRAVDAAPGNAGIARAGAQRFAIAAEDVQAIVSLVEQERHDLVVVGPEKPLGLGLADALAARGVPVFGCSQAASRIETSKAHAKALMDRAGVPTARYEAFDLAGPASSYARSLLGASGAVVIKADGLAAGKGVEICATPAAVDEALGRLLALPGGRVVVEEFLVGREASCMALVDGEAVLALPPCEDHKTVLDGDRGPMTGGMGAICPTPVVDAAMQARVEREVLQPIAKALVDEGTPFRGLLFAGLMITAGGPRVLEFNCRFGDPETEALLPLFDGDLARTLLAVAQGRAPTPFVSFRPGACCAVVLTAAGYPGGYAKGEVITGVDDAERAGATVFHAGTRDDGDRIVTDGGRVLVVTATGDDPAAARSAAYGAVERVRFSGAHFRKDIGARSGAGDSPRR